MRMEVEFRRQWQWGGMKGRSSLKCHEESNWVGFTGREVMEDELQTSKYIECAKMRSWISPRTTAKNQTMPVDNAPALTPSC